MPRVSGGGSPHRFSGKVRGYEDGGHPCEGMEEDVSSCACTGPDSGLHAPHAGLRGRSHCCGRRLRCCSKRALFASARAEPGHSRDPSRDLEDCRRRVVTFWASSWRGTAETAQLQRRAGSSPQLSGLPPIQPIACHQSADGRPLYRQGPHGVRAAALRLGAPRGGSAGAAPCRAPAKARTCHQDIRCLRDVSSLRWFRREVREGMPAGLGLLHLRHWSPNGTGASPLGQHR
mmetsp:Transcript_16882/g.37086  ORF Transcript_16882/g.37086 Transcript_16882/m.37086 type:complete len:232 (-) Transcript_16882:776-1471(-)